MPASASRSVKVGSVCHRYLPLPACEAATHFHHAVLYGDLPGKISRVLNVAGTGIAIGRTPRFLYDDRAMNREKRPVGARSGRGKEPKFTAQDWVDTARRVLVEEGIAGVKVDRLATRLGVTRGGFYYNFASRDELLERLLAAWENDCRFLPPEQPGNSPAEAVEWLDRVVGRLIEEDGYDPHFDMAVREWARSDQRAEWAVERRDRNRLARLQRFFTILGYETDEASMRARVFYFHQIGFYAIGVKASIADRRRDAKLYTEVLCGGQVLRDARGAPPVRKGRAVRGS
jgi:AcrR family transcriptional regulator